MITKPAPRAVPPSDAPSDSLADQFHKQVSDSIAAKERLLASPASCLEVGRVLIDAYRAGNQLFVFGNGGSAADSQHIAAEFLGRFYIERPGMAATALTDRHAANLHLHQPPPWGLQWAE